jgi:ABC-2 type transport system ATP-binding protein
MADPIIRVENLERTFSDVKAVDRVSFEINAGQVVGFIGANGAGKTTTMRIMTTLDQPQAGRVEICGYDVAEQPNEVRRRIGWMPDAYGTYENMTVFEYLDFFGRAFGFKKKARRQRVDAVMKFTDLHPLADRQINKLSKGMGQRLCMGRALINDPDVLILDEPAAGLDPKARIEFKNLVRLLAGEGKTIFLSSHILSELGEMCDNLLFIDAGRIVRHGATETFTRHSDSDSGCLVDIRVQGSADPLAAWIDMNPGVALVSRNQSGLRVRFDPTDDAFLAFNLRKMIQDGIAVFGFTRVERRLEEAFVDMLKSGESL